MQIHCPLYCILLCTSTSTYWINDEGRQCGPPFLKIRSLRDLSLAAIYPSHELGTEPPKRGTFLHTVDLFYRPFQETRNCICVSTEGTRNCIWFLGCKSHFLSCLLTLIHLFLKEWDKAKECRWGRKLMSEREWWFRKNDQVNERNITLPSANCFNIVINWNRNK